MSVTIYGIRNCDTIKKARAWLDEHGVEHTFHDYKKDGIDAERLERWCRKAGWEKLLNRAGTTLRRLAAAEKRGPDERKATALMLAPPPMIQRPVLAADSRVLVGFDPARYETELLSRSGSRR